MTSKQLSILGTRGIPAAHGGFETFAEKLSLYLVGKGWSVTVYCQEDAGDHAWEDAWQGVQLVHMPVWQSGAFGTIVFDWKCTWHASSRPGLLLTLGYNTAIFSLLYRLKGKTNLFNMDGMEWQRDKWNALEKAWLYLNERAGCWLGNHLIADHPEIGKHLSTCVRSDKITMIPYGADKLDHVDITPLSAYGLQENHYVLLIARPEPENSILEIVRAFSSRKRGFNLVVLGHYDPEGNAYHQLVMDAAGDEVLFLGAVYDHSIVRALRCYARLYVHGHTVGGTNPSLVEALGAGTPVLAHDNRFNRWVAGDSANYFCDEAGCSEAFDVLLDDQKGLARMRLESRRCHGEFFTWNKVLSEYETLLSKWAPS